MFVYSSVNNLITVKKKNKQTNQSVLQYFYPGLCKVNVCICDKCQIERRYVEDYTCSENQHQMSLVEIL